MIELKKIKKVIDKYKVYLEKKFKVESLSIFGSYIRGEQNEESDIDILVGFYEAPDLFEFIRLENFLSEQLGIKVDLVMKSALKPRIKECVFREAVLIYETGL